MDDIAMPSDFFSLKICILCLESNDTSYINIYSPEGRQLGAEGIIVKYFWLQPNEESPRTRSICSKCWNSVYSFHEFYLHVKRAHELLDEKVPVVFCESAVEDPIGDNIHIKLELDEKAEEVEVVNKSKRGRPRTKKCINTLSAQAYSIGSRKSVKSENIEFVLEDVKTLTPIDRDLSELNNVNIELEIESSVCTRRSGRLQNQKKRIPTIPKEELKNEEQPVEQSDAAKAEAVQGEDDKPHFDLDDQIIQANSAKKKSKKDKSEYLAQSEKYDEYIATNFSLTCPLCHIDLPTFNTLKKHFRDGHNLRGYTICCNRKFFKRCHLIDHIKLHQNPQTFKCPHCSKLLGERRSYELHVKRHDENRDRKYQCKICSKRYFSKTIYKRHILVHAPEEQKVVPCLYCEKKFATKYLMELHYRTVHLNLYAKFCEICGKSIRGKYAFQCHMEEHSGITQPICQCETCGARLTSKYNLSKHIKRMHSEESQTPQTCKICGKVSPGLSALRYHMNYMHRLQRIHACTFCDKTFKQATSLKEHLTTHTGGVLYTCTYCPKTFNSNANMYSHRKRAHRKEWEENYLQKYPKSKVALTCEGGTVKM